MKSGGSRRSSSLRPSKTLFVINFDAESTRTRDLERHFEPYGKIVNVRIRRNFAFIQYELQEDATRALEATNSRFPSCSFHTLVSFWLEALMVLLILTSVLYLQ